MTKQNVLCLVDTLEVDHPTTVNTDQSVTPIKPEVPLKKQDGVLYEKVKETVNNLKFINQIDENFFDMVCWFLF